MEQTKTPHDIAITIAEKNAESMRAEDPNAEGLGGGFRAAAQMKQILLTGPCSTCARLSVHPDQKTIGCSSTKGGPSPSSMARQLETKFTYELSCQDHIAITTEMELFQDENGVVRYRYKSEGPKASE